MAGCSRQKTLLLPFDNPLLSVGNRFGPIVVGIIAKFQRTMLRYLLI